MQEPESMDEDKPRPTQQQVKPSGRRKVPLVLQEEQPVAPKPAAKTTKTAGKKTEKTERPRKPLDEYEVDRIAEVGESIAKRAAKEAVAPFNVVISMKEVVHTKLMMWLSEQSRSLHNDMRVEMVIVDDEAIAFHTFPTLRVTNIKPINILLYQTPTEADKKAEAQQRTRAAHRQQKDSEKVVLGNELSLELLDVLNKYVAQFPAPLLEALKARCKCTLGTPGGSFFRIDRETAPDKFQYNIVYSVKEHSANEHDDITIVTMRFWHDPTTQGPPPHFLVYGGRLYGTLGYLLQRSEVLSRMKNIDESINAEYTLQHKRLIKLLDRGSYSCESITSAAKTCVGRAAAHMEQTAVESAYRTAVHNINSKDQLVQKLIAEHYYPPSEGPRLLQALKDNEFDVEELMVARNRIANSFAASKP